MKQNVVQNVIEFVLKYIWFFCAMLIVLELASVGYSASILMQQSALGVMQSVSGDVSGRVDGVLRLLTSMAADERFADTSKPLFDRAIQALPYQNGYGLYMIALTDEDVNVISADQVAPPTENFSLAYRDYMQRLYSTGEYQITDVFLSGDGKDTLNYTVAVPITKGGKVAGSVFGSIYFNDIEEILKNQSRNSGRNFYLLSSQNTIMAGGSSDISGKSFLELSGKSYIFGSNVEEINQSLSAGEPGDYWELDNNGLTYVAYQRVEPTNWSIVYRVQFMSAFAKLIPGMIVKLLFLVLLCAALHFFGHRYLERHLVQVNHLLNRMTVIQKELFQSECPDYDNLLEMTQQGLTDQLTGLATRAVLFQKMTQIMAEPAACGAVVFIDLDDLKRINDNFGHDGGDCALICFAQVLKDFERRYDGVAARYGGDEFVLLLPAIDDKAAPEVVQELCTALHTTVSTKEHTFGIHGSLGVSYYPRHGEAPSELICKADLALYAAKQSGKNQCVFFSENSSLI